MISLEVFEELLRASVEAGKLTEAQASVEAERRRAWLGRPQAAAFHVPHGPGTELKKLLSKVGITTKPGCACNKRARVMDAKGCDWCAENLSTITGWLKEEHARQKIMIPFSETAVSLLVRYAIRRARAIAK